MFMKYLLVYVKLICNDILVSLLGMVGIDWWNILWCCIQCWDIVVYCIQWWVGVDMNLLFFWSYLYWDMEVVLYSFDQKNLKKCIKEMIYFVVLDVCKWKYIII